MPFGRPGHGEFGTYFIGYSRTPRITETMLQNMFVGRPPGNYDRLLDFSKAVTGSLFFAPAATFLDNISEDAPDATAGDSSSNGKSPAADAASPVAPAPASSVGETSPRTLNIGSLKGQKDE
jgi:putative iron-dependent peroxidase